MAINDIEAKLKISALERELDHALARINTLQKQLAKTRAETERDLSSSLFRALFEHALDAIVIADDKGRYVDANPAAAELFGVSRTELLGKTPADFGPPDLDFEDAWHSFLKSEAEQGVFLLYLPDGELRYTEYAAVSGFLPGHNLSILRDVTERKQVERERERALYDLAERVKEAALLHEAGQLLNERDTSVEEVLGALVTIIPLAWQFPEVTAAQIQFGKLTVTAENFAQTPWCLRASFTTERGIAGAVEVSYLEERPEADEGPFLAEERAALTALSHMLQTEMERRAAIDDLRRSEATYRTLYETMAQGVVYHDATGRIVGANPAAARILGRSQEELRWQTADLLPRVIDEAGNRLNLEELPAQVALHSGRAVYDKVLGVPRADDAGYLWLVVNSIPQVRPEDSRPYLVCTTFEDISERKEREAERNRLVQDLQALTATLEEQVQSRTLALQTRTEQLRAVASALAVAEQRERTRISQILHDDLQQLLHAAQLRVLMLEEDLGDSAPSHILETVRAIDRLQDQSLAITRSLTVKLSPPVLEGEGLAEALGWLAGQMERVHGLQVSVTTEEAELASPDLRELAFQMVRELLFNVVKHARVDRAQLLVRKKGEICEITVADEGPGFDPSVIDRPEEHSAGYGLRAIRERLALFDGGLVVRSGVGGGARVTLLLPCQVAGDEIGHEGGTS